MKIHPSSTTSNLGVEILDIDLKQELSSKMISDIRTNG